MKKLLALAVLSFILVPNVSAHEGSIDLTGGNVSCKGVSIYQDGTYRVSGRCDGLVYPYETLYNKYVLWGKTTTRGEVTRIAEIDKGYFTGGISDQFDAMYITAEKDGMVRKMGDKQIVSGSVTPFSFDKSKTTSAPVTSTTTTSTTKAPTTTTVTSVAATTGTAGAVIGKIISSLLVVILVIVGLAIGASLLFRSRGSVSSH